MAAALPCGLCEGHEVLERHGLFERHSVRPEPYQHARAVIGTSTILDLNPAAESAHIGYAANAPEVWGTSVNPACTLLLLGHLFDHGYGRVTLQTDVLNARSRAGIQKLGARFEGIARRDAQV